MSFSYSLDEKKLLSLQRSQLIYERAIKDSEDSGIIDGDISKTFADAIRAKFPTLYISTFHGHKWYHLTLPKYSNGGNGGNMIGSMNVTSISSSDVRDIDLVCAFYTNQPPLFSHCGQEKIKKE
jgi:hypothetical protein